MIGELLQITDQAYGAVLPTHTRHLLARIVDGQPAVSAGNGQYVPIAEDLGGNWSYQRIAGEPSVEQVELPGEPCKGVRVIIPLRIVACLDSDTCEDIIYRAIHAVQGSAKAAITATGASDVKFLRASWDSDSGGKSEFQTAPVIPTQKRIITITFNIQIDARPSCLTTCEPVDVTCRIVGAASLAKLRECLGDRINELCEGGGECDPVTVNIYFNTVLQETLTDIDPCEEQNYNITPA